MEKKTAVKNLLFLNGLFLVYSATGVFLKLAPRHEYFSLDFLIFYFLAVIVIVIYAIGWQQALKRISLSSAYLNKSVVIIWGIIWSVVFFDEKIGPGIIVGGCLIMLGILLVVRE